MNDTAQAVVVVPAHNEREHLPRCLRALTTAALCLPVPVTIVVVLACMLEVGKRASVRVEAPATARAMQPPEPAVAHT